MGIELFFGFYFSGGGDFPVRGKVPSNNKALQADADKVVVGLFSGDLFCYF